MKKRVCPVGTDCVQEGPIVVLFLGHEDGLVAGQEDFKVGVGLGGTGEQGLQEELVVGFGFYLRHDLGAFGFALQELLEFF